MQREKECARAVIRFCFSLAAYPSLWRWRVAPPSNHMYNEEKSTAINSAICAHNKNIRKTSMKKTQKKDR